MQAKLTPLMQQYWDIKAQYTDEIVLFRMGDFFEMFHRDAELAAPIIGIALTQRNKKDSDSAKMCGVPHHSIATPIAKLLAAGHKVAICDQIEDPALAKGLVKRAVTRVLTPGMVYDPDTLDQLSANYICAYDEARMAFADVTTGEAFVYDYAGSAEREELLSLLCPVEMVLTSEQIREREAHSYRSVYSAIDLPFTSECAAMERLTTYIEKMQGAESLKALAPFEVRRRQQGLRVSAITFRHLEVFESSRGERKGSLFDALNRTQTSAGARLLKSWLLSPLQDLEEIQSRQNEIALWLSSAAPLRPFRQALAQLGDVERRLGKLHSTTFNARDLAAIAESIRVGAGLSEMHPSHPLLNALEECAELAHKISRTLNEELPLAVKEGGLIRRGAVRELDELIDLTQNGQRLLLELEAREKEATGIFSLKVRYNNVFGFYIELTKTHAHKAPEHYRRKQTLANAERYTTDELDQLEEKILSARSRRDQLEYEVFTELRSEVLALTPELLRLTRQWTRWDVLTSLAWLALERGYTCPRFSEGELHLELCRHPVVEQTLRSGFVPNTIHLDKGEALLLTGPNMAGKSTLMRQVALIVLMAQMGSYVPAQAARLPLFEEIFTRIGASDALNEGLSTFMVEMSETSQILKRVGSRSLVIMDEIGRGTSTYDGLSLAQAILEHLVSVARPFLFFATHYHELTKLAQLHPALHNAHMSVQEKGSQVQFLHTLQKGPANRSYGIHVARLAGLPAGVTSRAQSLLRVFEAGSGVGGSGGMQQLSLGEVPLVSEPAIASPSDPARAPNPAATVATTVPAERSSADPKLSAWIEEVQNLNLSQMTPLEALIKLSDLQRYLLPFPGHGASRPSEKKSTASANTSSSGERKITSADERIACSKSSRTLNASSRESVTAEE